MFLWLCVWIVYGQANANFLEMNEYLISLVRYQTMKTPNKLLDQIKEISHSTCKWPKRSFTSALPTSKKYFDDEQILGLKSALPLSYSFKNNKLQIKAEMRRKLLFCGHKHYFLLDLCSNFCGRLGICNRQSKEKIFWKLGLHLKCKSKIVNVSKCWTRPKRSKL